MTDEDDARRERIAECEIRLRELEAAIAEMEHRMRRVNDRIEREGVATGSLAAERERLQRNLQLNRRECDEIRGELGANEGTANEREYGRVRTLRVSELALTTCQYAQVEPTKKAQHGLDVGFPS